jgi:hypothetical protein
MLRVDRWLGKGPPHRLVVTRNVDHLHLPRDLSQQPPGLRELFPQRLDLQLLPLSWIDEDAVDEVSVDQQEPQVQVRVLRR